MHRTRCCWSLMARRDRTLTSRQSSSLLPLRLMPWPSPSSTVLREEIAALLEENSSTQDTSSGFDAPLPARPYVIMVVGVNGVGKTTTIAKLAYNFHKAGRSVLLGAADTFRAAAIDQLKIC